MTRGATNAVQKNNNKNKTTKHTIEFSNNTPPAAQQAPRLIAAYSWYGRRETHRSGASLWDIAALDGLGRVATTRSSYASANAESSNLLGRVFGARKIMERA